MHRAIIIFIAMGFCVNVFSQSVTYNHDDSVTYKLYMSKKWDKLIDYTDKVKDNSESYYTAYRIGAAYFEKSKYMPAANYFEKAYKKNNADELSAEYLYYSNLYSGRESDAQVLASSFSPQLKKKIKFSKPSFFQGIYTEGGYSFNAGYDNQKSVNTIGSESVFGVQQLLRGYYYANLSFTHSIGNKLSLFHGINFFNYTITKQFTEASGKKTEYSADAKQKGYYFSFKYNFGKGYGLLGGINFINTTGDNFEYSINKTGNTLNYNYFPYKYDIDDYALSLSLEKVFTYFKLAVSGSYSNLNQGKQFQGGFDFVYFPLGNLNLYGLLNSQLISNKSNGIGENRFLITPGIGFKVFKHLWLEAYYTIGDIYNLTDNNAFVIYNNTDVIKNKINVKSVIPVIYNKLDLSLNFEYYNIDNTYLTYLNTADYIIKNIRNTNYKFIGGIKWSF